MLVRRFSNRTVNTYITWIKSFILFHNKRHPAELHDQDIESYLTYLAVDRKVSIATQKIALNALAFLYNTFLDKPLGDVSQFRRVKRQPKIPVVLTHDEVRALFEHLKGVHRLQAALMYGSGLRRIEMIRLRVKDIDFDHCQIQVWNGKGYKHRLTTLAPELIPNLKLQIRQVEHYLHEDLPNPLYAGVWLPDALSRKYTKAKFKLGWHYLFPSGNLSYEPGTKTFDDTIWMNQTLIALLKKPQIRWVLLSKSPLIHYDIALQLTYWKAVLIFARYKNNWGIRTLKQRRFTPMC